MSLVQVPYLQARRTRCFAVEWTPDRLSRESGVPVGVIKAAENGALIGRDHGHALARALRCKLSMLVGWNGRTTATTFPPFGTTRTVAAGGLLHKVIDVQLTWARGQVSQTSARWECGRASTRARLFVELNPDLVRCEGCDFEGLQTAPEMVYLGIRGDLIKVGTSRRMVPRLVEQSLTHIDSCPGSYLDELELVNMLVAVTPPARGREWFPASPDLIAVVRGWMADRRLEAAS